MSATDPFIGEIRLVAFPFAPEGCALCDGRLLPVQQHTALYALLGTVFGGDGLNTFGLPDLRGRSPIGSGQGANLGNIAFGEYLGAEDLTLLQRHLPAHTHDATFASAGVRPGAVPANPVGEGGIALPAFAPAAQASAGMSPLPVDGQVVVQATGGGEPVDVRNPGLGLNFIIALQGVYPQRSA
jgi:microcystin-dependent protein